MASSCFFGHCLNGKTLVPVVSSEDKGLGFTVTVAPAPSCVSSTGRRLGAGVTTSHVLSTWPT